MIEPISKMYSKLISEKLTLEYNGDNYSVFMYNLLFILDTRFISQLYYTLQFCSYHLYLLWLFDILYCYYLYIYID